ncbi:HesA/MoeB/ThiF family protein [Inmirania thermothiophila]|uniref:Molybdopterin-synthase adenylyltransferase n=1 Tax=Inmirania thermothiophila TaxID=1750597 RepID=A0A3N1Y7K1_9GAMM|nr:molybdopterin-synthase adenylyltransferase MoeB [Inmirania thermothiophila]ROR34799.1 adenylyltransferase/sulfurtransferase [Inmirania thermothiophila]
MDDETLLRYSRQIMLPQVDIAGQERLLAAHAVILGLGGLGSPAALYLAAAGVGRLTLVDDDRVDLSNLQRQIVHGTPDIGRPKVASAAEALARINPDVRVETIGRRLGEAELAELAAGADVVLDGTDNFASRFTANAACQRAGTPLVSGAAIRFEGQVGVFLPGGPCYRCLYRDEGAPEDRCVNAGVFTPVVGVVGSLQAVEAMKLILGIGRSLSGRLLLLDLLGGEIRSVALRRDPACPVCSGAAARTG